jgi:hypothetical protein
MVEEAILSQDENFLDNLNAQTEDFDFASLFDDENDLTTDTTEENPYEDKLTIYREENKFYTDLFEQLIAAKQLSRHDIVTSEGYVEIVNTKELNDILFDLPPESKPLLNQLYRLSLDKELVQKAIEDARKTKGEWAKFQILYELHPLVKYFMTKLEAGVDKDTALVAKTRKLPANTAWFVFLAQISNQIGQVVLAQFFVVGLNDADPQQQVPMPLNRWIQKYELDQTLHTEAVSANDLELLQSKIPTAVAAAAAHAKQQHENLKQNMTDKLTSYIDKVNAWHIAAGQQLEVDFEGEEASDFRMRIKNSKQLEIDSVKNESLSYFNDITALQQEPYLKVLAVFYN